MAPKYSLIRMVDCSICHCICCFSKTVRIQRTGKKAADEAIEVLTDAQNGTNKMKYIDPVKNDAFKSQTTVRKR